jgi:UDP-N-acetylglucosamine 2-epimerase (non-hydrolysing)
VSVGGASAVIHVPIGTRAQLIKMAPVLHAIERAGLPMNLLFTGQHRVTMQDLLDDFGIRAPPRLLDDRGEVGGVLQMAGWFCRCLWRLRRRGEWLPGSPRSIVLVHGDTVSTLLGALAGRGAGLRVAHVEAGLRSHRLFHPFPEELTRLAVSRLSDVGYCPGRWAADNLRGLKIEAIDVGHNTLLDAVRGALERRPAAGAAAAAPYFVASIHRFENVFLRRRLAGILDILKGLADRARCVFVLHPITEAKLRGFGLLDELRRDARFELRPRMAYSPFVGLLAGARFVVSDGGSNQEELSYLGIPTVLMRAATERQEGVGGCVLVSGYDAGRIAGFLDSVKPQPAAALQQAPSPSELIARHLKTIL